MGLFWECQSSGSTRIHQTSLKIEANVACLPETDNSCFLVQDGEIHAAMDHNNVRNVTWKKCV
jgi:hypothetical protein